MIDRQEIYWEKATENLAAAQSEYVNDRYNSATSRAYYACFQAAVFVLAQAGIRPPGRGQWGHEFVQAQFNGELVGRRHLYPTFIRGTLNQNLMLRLVADYSTDHVTEVRADRAITRAEQFLEALRPTAGGQP